MLIAIELADAASSIRLGALCQTSALATATSTAGLLQWQGLLKPLTMGKAIILIATSALSISTRGQFDLISDLSRMSRPIRSG